MTNPFSLVPGLPSDDVESLEARLNRHPALKGKIESLLAVVEDAEGDLIKADAAEQRVIEEIRQLGQAALQGWATRSNQAQSERFKASHPEAHRTRKKNSTGTVDSGSLKS